jgi:hypothetical protein
VYIDEFKDLIDLSGYTDPITIVLKFHWGLNAMTQKRIVTSGMDRPQDMDLNGWFKATWCLDLNHLANEAFHYAFRCPLTQTAPTLTTHSTPPHTLFSFLCSQALIRQRTEMKPEMERIYVDRQVGSMDLVPLLLYSITLHSHLELHWFPTPCQLL